MSLRVVVSLSLLLLPLGLAPACGSKLPKATATRESGQSGLMNDSFAAQNACNPKNHLRPFIIEWDATDKSSFEAYAASDIVVVRYEGCDMQVLEECRNDSVRGSQGAYKPVDWTSGALEKLDISNQGELHAKLPLSVGTLGGRVEGGEKFHMEYYVAGTRTATRDSVYRDDIASNPGCEGATHFVYNYNLGAFALGSVTEFSAAVEASLYGFGGGGSTNKRRSADKQGGDLGTCKSDSAREVEGCKAPIRLTLRPIRDGRNPQQDAMEAEDTPESLNAAGMVNLKMELGEKAQAHFESATAKMQSKDGAGCLKELDEYDRLEPKRKSTDPKIYVSMTRAQCLMIAGKCDAGKVLLRKSYESTMAQWSPEQRDKGVDSMVGMYCQGGMGPRDELLSGYMALSMANTGAKKLTLAECEDAYKKVRKNAAKVKPNDDEDYQVISASRDLYAMAPGCWARAGDCKRARAVFDETFPPDRLDSIKDAKVRAESQKSIFESMVKKCKE